MDGLKHFSQDGKYLFVDLKPGERIYKVIHEYIYPELEKIGFKMSKSPLIIKRKVDEFEQEIYFQKRSLNHANQIVAFRPHLNVTSKFYSKWYFQKYGVTRMNEYIMGSPADYVPGWDKKYLDNCWYDLAVHHNLEIVELLKMNIITKGLPYLNTFSNKQSAIDFILNSNSFYYTAPMLFDFAFMLGDKKQAEGILKWFTDFSNTSETKWQDSTIRDLSLRNEVLKNWY